jgi:translation elongation factor EF-G
MLDAVKGDPSILMRLDGNTAKTFFTSDNPEYLESFWRNLHKNNIALRSSHAQITAIYRQVKTGSGEIKYLWPMMTIEIVVSKKETKYSPALDAKTAKGFIDDLLHDFKKLMGRITSQDDLEDTFVLHGIAPLEGMFGIKASRVFNANRATYTMKYSHHEPIPEGDPGPFRMAAAMRET